MRFILLAFALWAAQITAFAQQCSYRTDEPREVPGGHVRVSIKGSFINTVKGDVTDQAGTSLKGVAVVLSKIKNGKSEYVGGVFTDEEGKFCFGVMPEGKYKIEFGHREFNSVEIEFKVRWRSSSNSIHVDLPIGT